MRHRPEINFTASRRLPPRKYKTEGGFGIRVDCAPRDGEQADFDLAFHCQTLATKSCMKLWGLSQINPLLNSHDYLDLLNQEYFDEATKFAPNARRYIEIFDDCVLADEIVGIGGNKPLRFWDALGTIMHGKSFVAGYAMVPKHPVIDSIHELLERSLDEALTSEQQTLLDALGKAAMNLPPMRRDSRIVGYTITSDRKKEHWVSIERMAEVFLDHRFDPLAEWRRNAVDFRTPVEE